MTLDLRPEIAEGLKALATAQGLSVEAYLQQLVERELPAQALSTSSEGSGMVWENGLFVYRTGKPLPAHIVDDAIRRSRQERLENILGNHS
ncbi:MAG TPA: hypothetical protein VNV88_03140 [Candidatus Solibacter sp.]|jgi:hypothetical protein|nr:hypothetical protein [Candidatus Solibacter sp.]